MFQSLSVRQKILITSPLWVMPFATLIVNSSYFLVRSTYMNGVLGFWIFISLPSVLALISALNLIVVYKNEKKYWIFSVAGCLASALIGTILTFVIIVTGGYTIA